MHIFILFTSHQDVLFKVRWCTGQMRLCFKTIFYKHYSVHRKGIHSSQFHPKKHIGIFHDFPGCWTKLVHFSLGEKCAWFRMKRCRSWSSRTCRNVSGWPRTCGDRPEGCEISRGPPDKIFLIHNIETNLIL